MTPSDRFIADKATIRAELERRAKARQPTTYGEAAQLIGRPAGGIGAILAAIRAEGLVRGRPDLTALLVTVNTGLPKRAGVGPEARERAIAVQEAVFRAWSASG